MTTKRAAKRKSVVADASSLILLTKSGLLESALKPLEIFVPDEVYEEAVTRGKAKGQADAYELETYFQANKLQKKSPGRASQQTIENLFNLRAGERDTLALAQELGRSDVLIDDKKGINACKALSLPFATSLGVLLTLRRQGIISKDKAYNALGQLEQHGWCDKALMQWARSEIDAT